MPAAKTSPTPLAGRLARLIAGQGPLTIAEYMTFALADPEQGYYMSAEPFGRSGDFTTAPEISQMFGELLGLWAVDSWQRMGAPNRFVLAELGPGRGTLLADALRAAQLAPGFLAAAELHLVEISPRLRALQQDRLASTEITWHEDVGQLPAAPLLLIANEFFDAQPLRQFERHHDGWCERVVTVDAAGNLAFGQTTPDPATALIIPEPLRAAPEGTLYEVAPAALAQVEDIGRRIASTGGAALIIDYGHDQGASGHSLQAVRNHNTVDPLSAPGAIDLSAHVDFAALAQAAARTDLSVFGPVQQGLFLKALGIDLRAEALLKKVRPGQAETVTSAVTRLTEPEAMGSLFKVLGLCHNSLAGLAGFPG